MRGVLGWRSLGGGDWVAYVLPCALYSSASLAFEADMSIDPLLIYMCVLRSPKLTLSTHSQSNSYICLSLWYVMVYPPAPGPAWLELAMGGSDFLRYWAFVGADS